MRPIKLAGFDLNLFVVFEALFEERHVSRAGAKIGFSQPSMSHALGRLRAIFEDELFIRRPGGMIPTARALELAQHILPGLGQLKSAIQEGPGFRPEVSERRFVIGLNDMGSFSVLPRFAPLLRAQAPGATLTIINVGARDAVDKLVSGEIELACGVFQELPSSVESQTITSFQSVCLTDANNPMLMGRPLDLKTFLELPHIQIAVNADPGLPLDAELAALSLRRQVALVVPHFLSVPSAVLDTDMIGLFPDSFLQSFRDWPLRVDPLPLPLPDLSASMIWHRRNRSDPGHRWLRETLIAAISGEKADGMPHPLRPDDLVTNCQPAPMKVDIPG